MSTAIEDVSLPVKDGTAPPLRVISAASLFDGHDAAINIIRRLLQAHGAEVIHLGHNRSVGRYRAGPRCRKMQTAFACSSYQGGHNEYFRYMVDMLRERGAEHIRVIVGRWRRNHSARARFAGLEAHGVEKIYDAEAGLDARACEGMVEGRIFARVRSPGRSPRLEPGPAGPRRSSPVSVRR